MRDSDGVRTAPPTVPEALNITIKESIRNAVLSGQRAMRVGGFASLFLLRHDVQGCISKQ